MLSYPLIYCIYTISALNYVSTSPLDGRWPIKSQKAGLTVHWRQVQTITTHFGAHYYFIVFFIIVFFIIFIILLLFYQDFIKYDITKLLNMTLHISDCTMIYYCKRLFDQTSSPFWSVIGVLIIDLDKEIFSSVCKVSS